MSNSFFWSQAYILSWLVTSNNISDEMWFHFSNSRNFLFPIRKKLYLKRHAVFGSTIVPTRNYTHTWWSGRFGRSSRYHLPFGCGESCRQSALLPWEAVCYMRSIVPRHTLLLWHHHAQKDDVLNDKKVFFFLSFLRIRFFFKEKYHSQKEQLLLQSGFLNTSLIGEWKRFYEVI